MKIQFKKYMAMTFAALFMNSFCITSANAQGGVIELLLLSISIYTYNIQNYTYGALKVLNDSLSDWIKPDDSKTTQDMQSDFSQYYKDMTDDTNLQRSMQGKMLNFYFGPKATEKTLPNANDLSYSYLYGEGRFKPDPRAESMKGEDQNPAFYYVMNASGLNIPHVLPPELGSWQGPIKAQSNYSSFYNTISAVSTFDGYVLSDLYVDYKNQHKLTDTQNKLLQRATSGDWFVQVSKESLGIVMRQILMYDSQMFVLMVKLLDTEKQALTAHAMTNTLLILLNQQNEDTLLKKATGVMPPMPGE